MAQVNLSRRDFVKKATYIAPVILTLRAMPSFAKNGSPQNGTPVPPEAPNGTSAKQTRGLEDYGEFVQKFWFGR